jgi:hypothetical protein
MPEVNYADDNINITTWLVYTILTINGGFMIMYISRREHVGIGITVSLTCQFSCHQRDVFRDMYGLHEIYV